MGRKKAFDRKKIAEILSVLARNPDGIWLRRLAEETRLSPATVSKYIETVLKGLVDDVSLGNYKKPLLRVVKLKPSILERVQRGDNIEKVLKMLRILYKS